MRREAFTRRLLTSAVTAALLLGVTTSPAAGASGDGKYYYLSNALRGGEADETFAYGKEGDAVFVGDWNGDGVDTLGVRRGAQYFLSDDFDGGDADVTFTYGRDSDEVFLGDWDGDGVDTPAVRRGRTYYVTNRLRGGKAESVFVYGRVGDVVLVGDWDGDGDDTFAVRRGRTYYVANQLRGGVADVTFDYGRPNDLVYVGDWDGDGDDTFAVRRSSTYYVNNRLQGGQADQSFAYGRPSDITLVGDWDGKGGDTFGVRRAERPALIRVFEGRGDDIVTYDLDSLGPVVATVTHSGRSNFVLWTFDSSGDKSDLLVNEIGNYSGRVGANFDSRWTEHRGFDITADGDWRIEIRLANSSPNFSASGGSGRADDVRGASALAGEAVRIQHSGDSNFVVWAVDGAGRRFDLIVNEIGDYSGTRRVPVGTAWLEITADGSWSLSR